MADPRLRGDVSGPRRKKRDSPSKQQEHRDAPRNDNAYTPPQQIYSSTRDAPIYAEPEEDLNMRRPRRRYSSDNASSSSSSYLDISRTIPIQRRSAIGIIRSFFSAPPDKRRRVRRHRSRATMKHGNSSSSSLDSNLAYGTGFVKKRKEKYGPAYDARRERETSGVYAPAGSALGKKRKEKDPELEMLEVGAGLAALAKKQNRMDLIEGRRQGIMHVKREDSGRQGYGVKGLEYSRGLGPSKPTHALDEDGWESASDDESDSSASVDSGLAYGAENTWLWGRPRPPMPVKRKSTIVDPKLFGPQNSLNGVVTRPVGFGETDINAPGGFVPEPSSSAPRDTIYVSPQQPPPAPSLRPKDRGYVPPPAPVRRESSGHSSGSLQRVYPIPTTDPLNFDAGRSSVASAQDQPIYNVSRTDSLPLRQPKPFTPVSQTIYEQSSIPAHADSTPRKRDSSGHAATFAGAGLAGVALAGMAASRLDKRRGDDRDEYERAKRRERRREEGRAPDEDRERRRESRRERDGGDRPRRDEDPAYRPDERRERRRGEDRVEYSTRDPTSASRHLPVDPFQYQVADDAFEIADVPPKMRQIAAAGPSARALEKAPERIADHISEIPMDNLAIGSTIERGYTPAIVTVERVPKFAREGARTPDVSHEPARESRYDGPSETRGRTREQSPEEIRPVHAETEQPTAPSDATAAEGHSAERVFKKGRRESYSSSTEQERDLIQENADRVYRETIAANKAAASEPLARPVTPQNNEEDKDKGPYDSPNADFKLDHTMIPAELPSFSPAVIGTFPASRNLDANEPFDPAMLGLSRPLLNLVKPTPTPEEQKLREAKTDAEVHDSAKSHEAQEPENSERDISTASASEPKAIAEGEDEIESFVVVTPHDEASQSTVMERDVDAASEPPKKKSSRWGDVRIAFIARAAEIKAEEAAQEKEERARLAEERAAEEHSAPTEAFEYRGVVVEPEVEDESLNREIPGDDHKDPGPPPSVGPKPSVEQHSAMPGSFDDDIDFTATVAAGLQDSGFDPNIVINDASFVRRTTPPGSDVQTVIYHKPFSETVTDLGVYERLPSGPNDRPLLEEHDEAKRSEEIEKFPVSEETRDRGLDLEETEAAISHVTEEPELQGDDNETDEFAFTKKLSKKERKKLEKEAEMLAQELDDAEAMKSEAVEEPEIAQTQDDDNAAEEFAFTKKLSKKEQRRLEKEAAKMAWDKELEEAEAEDSQVVEEPEITKPQDDNNAADEFSFTKKLSKKEQKRLEKEAAKLARDRVLELEETEARLDPIVEEPEISKSQGEDDKEADEFRVTRKLSKKEQRRLDKEAERQTRDRELDLEETQVTGSQTPQETDEFAEFTTSKKSKKPKKSRKSSAYPDDTDDGVEGGVAKISVPIDAFDDLRHDDTAAPLDEWDVPKKSKRKSKRGDEVFEDAHESLSRKGSKKNKSKGNATQVDDDHSQARSVTSEPAEDDTTSVVSESIKKPSRGSGFFGFFGSSSNKSDVSETEKVVKSAVTDEAPGLMEDESHMDGSNGISNGNAHDAYEEDEWASATKGKKKKKKQKNGIADDEASSGKDSFLAKAGTLGAGVGVVGAVAVAAALHQQSKADDADSKDDLGTRSLPAESQPQNIAPDNSQDPYPNDIVDPEIVERPFRVSIDPEYRDLLALPPSDPGSPDPDPPADLPALPDSRPASPPGTEHLITHDMSLLTPRKSEHRQATRKAASFSAVPIKFMLGNRSTPSSPGLTRPSPLASPLTPGLTRPSSLMSPLTPGPDATGFTRAKSRPTSWDNSREIKPLLLLDASRRESLLSDEERPARPRSLEDAYSLHSRRSSLATAEASLTSPKTNDVADLPPLPESREASPERVKEHPSPVEASVDEAGAEMESKDFADAHSADESDVPGEILPAEIASVEQDDTAKPRSLEEPTSSLEEHPLEQVLTHDDGEVSKEFGDLDSVEKLSLPLEEQILPLEEVVLPSEELILPSEEHHVSEPVIIDQDDPRDEASMEPEALDYIAATPMEDMEHAKADPNSETSPTSELFEETREFPDLPESRPLTPQAVTQEVPEDILEDQRSPNLNPAEIGEVPELAAKEVGSFEESTPLVSVELAQAPAVPESDPLPTALQAPILDSEDMMQPPVLSEIDPATSMPSEAIAVSESTEDAHEPMFDGPATFEAPHEFEPSIPIPTEEFQAPENLPKDAEILERTDEQATLDHTDDGHAAAIDQATPESQEPHKNDSHLEVDSVTALPALAESSPGTPVDDGEPKSLDNIIQETGDSTTGTEVPLPHANDQQDEATRAVEDLPQPSPIEPDTCNRSSHLFQPTPQTTPIKKSKIADVILEHPTQIDTSDQDHATVHEHSVHEEREVAPEVPSESHVVTDLDATDVTKDPQASASNVKDIVTETLDPGLEGVDTQVDLSTRQAEVDPDIAIGKEAEAADEWSATPSKKSKEGKKKEKKGKKRVSQTPTVDETSESVVLPEIGLPTIPPPEQAQQLPEEATEDIIPTVEAVTVIDDEPSAAQEPSTQVQEESAEQEWALKPSKKSKKDKKKAKKARGDLTLTTVDDNTAEPSPLEADTQEPLQLAESSTENAPVVVDAVIATPTEELSAQEPYPIQDSEEPMEQEWALKPSKKDKKKAKKARGDHVSGSVDDNTAELNLPQVDVEQQPVEDFTKDAPTVVDTVISTPDEESRPPQEPEETVEQAWAFKPSKKDKKKAKKARGDEVSAAVDDNTTESSLHEANVEQPLHPIDGFTKDAPSAVDAVIATLDEEPAPPPQPDEPVEQAWASKPSKKDKKKAKKTRSDRVLDLVDENTAELPSPSDADGKDSLQVAEDLTKDNASSDIAFKATLDEGPSTTAASEEPAEQAWTSKPSKKDKKKAKKGRGDQSPVQVEDTTEELPSLPETDQPLQPAEELTRGVSPIVDIPIATLDEAPAALPEPEESMEMWTSKPSKKDKKKAKKSREDQASVVVEDTTLKLPNTPEIGDEQPLQSAEDSIGDVPVDIPIAAPDGESTVLPEPSEMPEEWSSKPSKKDKKKTKKGRGGQASAPAEEATEALSSLPEADAELQLQPVEDLSKDVPVDILIGTLQEESTAAAASEESLEQAWPLKPSKKDKKKAKKSRGDQTLAPIEDTPREKCSPPEAKPSEDLPKDVLPIADVPIPALDEEPVAPAEPEEPMEQAWALKPSKKDKKSKKAKKAGENQDLASVEGSTAELPIPPPLEVELSEDLAKDALPVVDISTVIPQDEPTVPAEPEEPMEQEWALKPSKKDKKTKKAKNARGNQSSAEAEDTIPELPSPQEVELYKNSADDVSPAASQDEPTAPAEPDEPMEQAWALKPSKKDKKAKKAREAQASPLTAAVEAETTSQSKEIDGFEAGYKEDQLALAKQLQAEFGSGAKKSKKSKKSLGSQASTPPVALIAESVPQPKDIDGFEAGYKEDQLALAKQLQAEFGSGAKKSKKSKKSLGSQASTPPATIVAEGISQPKDIDGFDAGYKEDQLSLARQLQAEFGSGSKKSKKGKKNRSSPATPMSNYEPDSSYFAEPQTFEPVQVDDQSKELDYSEVQEVAEAPQVIQDVRSVEVPETREDESEIHATVEGSKAPEDGTVADIVEIPRDDSQVPRSLDAPELSSGIAGFQEAVETPQVLQESSSIEIPEISNETPDVAEAQRIFEDTFATPDVVEEPMNLQDPVLDASKDNSEIPEIVEEPMDLQDPVFDASKDDFTIPDVVEKPMDLEDPVFDASKDNSEIPEIVEAQRDLQDPVFDASKDNSEIPEIVEKPMDLQDPVFDVSKDDFAIPDVVEKPMDLEDSVFDASKDNSEIPEIVEAQRDLQDPVDTVTIHNSEEAETPQEPADALLSKDVTLDMETIYREPENNSPATYDYSDREPQWHTPSRLPVVLEEDSPDLKKASQTPPEDPIPFEVRSIDDINRDSAFVAESPIQASRSLSADQEYSRDSGVHLRERSHSRTPPERRASPLPSPAAVSDDALARLSWPPVNEADETIDLNRPKTRKIQEQAKAPHLSFPPPDIGLGVTGVALAAAKSYDKLSRGESPELRRSSGEIKRLSTPHRIETQRGDRKTPEINRLHTPEQIRSRPGSAAGRFSSGTPPLRRSDRKTSGDLRSLSQRSQPNLDETARETKHSPTGPNVSDNSNPIANEGRVRVKDMADVYDGYGEGRVGSPMSPTRPHSMRRRQSMQVIDLEAKLEQLAAENRMLAEAKEQAEFSLHQSQRATSDLADRDAEIDTLKRTLDWFHKEVDRLKEINEGLTSANITLGQQHDDRYSRLEAHHAQATRELEDERRAHGNLSEGMAVIIQGKVQEELEDKERELERLRQDKDLELEQLRRELDDAREQIREMQRQILASKKGDAEFLVVRDEDYFDNACQQLCQHVQQWILRFSKFSDMRACRLTSEISNDKIIDRLDNAVLDGSDVDDYLSDRVRRRDIFMSMTMTMVWEYIFTRYLFGMDREQRQKLKSLEKMLLEVGPAAAVHQWRATTLTLLARRPAFAAQRDQDTEAVVQAIFQTLSTILPPPTNLEEQIQVQLRRVVRVAVELSIEMRTQRAQYMMLPPLQPEYDANGDLAREVAFNAALMSERGAEAAAAGARSGEELEAEGAVVQVVLFPLVVKQGDDEGVGEEEIVVCPAQVLVAKHRPGSRFGGGSGRGSAVGMSGVGRNSSRVSVPVSDAVVSEI